MKVIFALCSLWIMIYAATYDILVQEDAQVTRAFYPGKGVVCTESEINPLGADSYMHCPPDCHYPCAYTIAVIGVLANISEVKGLVLSAVLTFTRPEDTTVNWSASTIRGHNWQGPCWIDWEVSATHFTNGTTTSPTIFVDVTELVRASTDGMVGVALFYNGYGGVYCGDDRVAPLRVYSRKDGANPPILRVLTYN